jgi:hypothetical protein
MHDAMNNSNHALFHHSYHEVLQDQDYVMERLALDSEANDTRLEALYEKLHKKL